MVKVVKVYFNSIGTYSNGHGEGVKKFRTCDDAEKFVNKNNRKGKKKSIFKIIY